jgi:hypothetical protein
LIDIPQGHHEATWRFLLHLAEVMPDGWTLIGAEMVNLHAYEAGVSILRTSADADILVNARVATPATKAMSSLLVDEGFELTGRSTENVGHKFVRGTVTVDVLAPDGLGPRARIETHLGAHTVQVPGGTQALKRTQRVDIRIGSIVGQIPRPNLTGALLIKARAVEVDDLPEAQRRDLALLLSLVPDPFVIHDEMTPTERGWLSRRVELAEPNGAPWEGIERADQGRDALRIIIASISLRPQ